MSTATLSGPGTSGSGSRPRSDMAREYAEEGLRDLARDFKEHGPRYATEYLRYLKGERTQHPQPAGVHPKIAAAIRDVVVDGALAAGMRGVRVK